MAYYLDFETHTDGRGHLTVIEKKIPFDIKRVFYVYGVSEEETRGRHRHYKTIHALICLRGSCEVYVDNGVNKEVFVLDAPDKGLILLPEDWHAMYNFSNDALLLALASEYYDPGEYIPEEYQ